MIRALTVIGACCFIGAFAVLAIDAEGNGGLAVILLMASVAISFVLGIRRGYHKVSGIVADARSFVSGDIQHARLASVGEPRGWFTPESEIELHLEGEDGNVHSIQRGVSVPFPLAWSYRLGKRFNLPLLGGIDLTEMMATELKREGMSVSVSRPAQAP